MADARPTAARNMRMLRSFAGRHGVSEEVLNTSRRQEEGRCSVTSDEDGDGDEKERKTKGREDERMNDSAQEKLVWQ